MCFFVTSSKRVADKDIPCFKVLDSQRISPHRYFQYDDKVTPRVKILPENRKIYQGYHVYRKFDRAQTTCSQEYNVYNAIIPKGTIYYSNSTEMVAEKLKVLDPIPVVWIGDLLEVSSSCKYRLIHVNCKLALLSQSLWSLVHVFKKDMTFVLASKVEEIIGKFVVRGNNVL